MDGPIDNGPQDMLSGLELQLIELVERQQRAQTQGRAGDAAALQPQIDELHVRMAAAAEEIASVETAESDHA